MQACAGELLRVRLQEPRLQGGWPRSHKGGCACCAHLCRLAGRRVLDAAGRLRHARDCARYHLDVAEPLRCQVRGRDTNNVEARAAALIVGQHWQQKLGAGRHKILVSLDRRRRRRRAVGDGDGCAVAGEAVAYCVVEHKLRVVVQQQAGGQRQCPRDRRPALLQLVQPPSSICLETMCRAPPRHRPARSAPSRPARCRPPRRGPLAQPRPRWSAAARWDRSRCLARKTPAHTAGKRGTMQHAGATAASSLSILPRSRSRAVACCIGAAQPPRRMVSAPGSRRGRRCSTRHP